MIGSFTSISTMYRGVVKTIEFPELNVTYRTVNKWVGQEIEIDGIVYIVKGVETFKTCEDLICTKAGILI